MIGAASIYFQRFKLIITVVMFKILQPGNPIELLRRYATVKYILI